MEYIFICRMYVQYCIVLVKLVQSLLHSSVSNYLGMVERGVLLFMAPYVVLLTVVNHFQSQEDVDKKKDGVCICHLPWKISQLGELRVSNFLPLCEYIC